MEHVKVPCFTCKIWRTLEVYNFITKIVLAITLIFILLVKYFFIHSNSYMTISLETCCHEVLNKCCYICVMQCGLDYWVTVELNFKLFHIQNCKSFLSLENYRYHCVVFSVSTFFFFSWNLLLLDLFSFKYWKIWKIKSAFFQDCCLVSRWNRKVQNTICYHELNQTKVFLPSFFF